MRSMVRGRRHRARLHIHSAVNGPPIASRWGGTGPQRAQLRIPERPEHRRTEARGRRRSARSHGLCRQRARCRPIARCGSLRRWLRGGRALRSAPDAPAMMAERIDRRVLAARVVVGDDHDVGQCATPLRPFAGRLPWSRSPPAPKTVISAPFDVRPERGDRGFQRVGGVGVIDVDGNSGAADHRALEPPAHRRNPLHRREGRIPLAACREHQCRRGQHVRRLIGADQREGEPVALAFMLHDQSSGRGRSESARRGGSSRPARPTVSSLWPALRRPLDHFAGFRIVGPDHRRRAAAGGARSNSRIFASK